MSNSEFDSLHLQAKNITTCFIFIFFWFQILIRPYIV